MFDKITRRREDGTNTTATYRELVYFVRNFNLKLL